MRRLATLCAICCLALPLSGCIARLLLLDEAELAVMRRAAVEGLAETEASSSLLLRASRMGITAEEVSVLSRATAVIREGRLLAAEEVAFNSEVGEIQLVRRGAQNPRLTLRGAAEPFAEVLPREGRIRLFNDNTITIPNDIYSVERDIVLVRRTPSVASDNVVATLRQGDLAVRLTESGGWYQVRVVQAGREVTGFIDAGFLAPLVVGSRENREKVSPHSAISAIDGETKQRWAYYWARPGGNMVPQVSAEDAMSILFHDFGTTGADRKVAYSMKDWPAGVTSFVKVDSDNLPILSKNTFKDADLRILGFTKAGELLQYVAFRAEGVKINNPLDWGPKNYGEWYQVKTRSGDEGWVLTRPFDQTYSSGTVVKRCGPSRIEIKSVSVDLYRVYIDDVPAFDMRGETRRVLDRLPAGPHTVRVQQLNGYLLWATDKTFRVTVNCGERISIVYP